LVDPSHFGKVAVDRALLDTDTVCDLLQGSDPGLLSRARRYHERFGLFTISSLTVLELTTSLGRLGRRADASRLGSLLGSEAVLPIDAAAAELAGDLSAELERGGQSIGWSEAVLAAQALQHHLVLVTTEPRRYEPIRDAGRPLTLGTWRRPPTDGGVRS
jgi:predicted nucleic acid-binding protein